MAYRDPFQSTPDAAAYVGRTATEEALASLQRAVASGEQLVAFGGPPGIGKTLLAHVLADRCQHEMTVVSIPVASLPPEGLYGWVLATLGIPAGEDPRESLVTEVRRAAGEGRALLVSVDDAAGLPEETAVALRELHAEVVPALRLVFVMGEDESSKRLLSLLGPDTTRVWLDQPMTSGETAAYVHARLARVGLSGREIIRFDPATIERLHRESGGLPIRVNEFADAVLRPAPLGQGDDAEDDLRPESLAFGLLSEAENDQRMTDWSDAELVRVVTAGRSSRSSRSFDEDSRLAAQALPDTGRPSPETDASPSDALLSGPLPAPLPPSEAPRTAGFAAFLQTLPPTSSQDGAPARDVEPIVDAWLAAGRGEAPASELPELPESSGLGGRILSALHETSEIADEPSDLAPEPVPSAQAPAQPNPVAEQIIAALSTSETGLDEMPEAEPLAASPDAGSTAAHVALPVADPTPEVDPIPAALEAAPEPLAEEAVSVSIGAIDDAPESVSQPGLELAAEGAPLDAPEGSISDDSETSQPDSLAELEVAITDRDEPVRESQDDPSMVPVEVRPSLPVVGDSEAPVSAGLPREQTDDPRRVRSLGVFGGADEPRESLLGQARIGLQPAGDLASRMARELGARRNRRTEIFALSAGLVLLLAGGLVYWNTDPSAVVTSSMVAADRSPFVPNSMPGLVDEATVAVEPAVVEEPLVVAEPVLGEASPSDPTPKVASTGEGMAPAESAAVIEPAAVAQEETTAETVEVALTSVSDAVPEDPSESQRIAPPTGGAIAGMRPPAAIAAPAFDERVLPVTVLARPGLIIEIDGVVRGEAPLFGLLLTEGTHRAAAAAADGTRSEFLFEVDEQNLEVRFNPPASR